MPARAAVTEAMKRHLRGELMRYEEEHVGGELHAIRVFFDSNTYRLLYAHEGKHDQVLLALHCIQKKDRKLPRRARDLALRRLKDWRSRDKCQRTRQTPHWRTGRSPLTGRRSPR